MINSDSVEIGLAISGGVDSMALAALCSRLQDLSHQRLHSGTNKPPLELSSLDALKFRAFVVDHGSRPGSHLEAEAVSKLLERRGSYFSIYVLAQQG